MEHLLIILLDFKVLVFVASLLIPFVSLFLRCHQPAQLVTIGKIPRDV